MFPEFLDTSADDAVPGYVLPGGAIQSHTFGRRRATGIQSNLARTVMLRRQKHPHDLQRKMMPGLGAVLASI